MTTIRLSVRASLRRTVAVATVAACTLGVAVPASATEVDDVPTPAMVGTTADGNTLVLTPGQTSRPAVPSGTGFDAFRARMLAPEDGLPDTFELAGRTRFDTLSAALVGTFAAQEGRSVDDFLMTNQLQESAMLPRLDAPTSLQSLDRQLAMSGMSFAGSGATSLRSWASSLAASPSIDGVVTLQAAAWADEIQHTAMPKLLAPKLGNTPSISDEALLFGLFAKDSFTEMASSYPDAFAEVASTGVASPGARLAFDRSMRSSAARLTEGAAGGLFDGCSSAFLGAMATGDASIGTDLAGRGCGGCAAAGVSANSMVNKLIDVGTTANTSLYAPGDNVLQAHEFASLPGWITGPMLERDPDLAAALHPDAPPSSMCTQGVASAVSKSLPNVLNNVSGR